MYGALLEASVTIVLVAVTSFSVQDVRVEFPKPEKQLVETEVTMTVHA